MSRKLSQKGPEGRGEHQQTRDAEDEEIEPVNKGGRLGTRKKIDFGKCERRDRRLHSYHISITGLGDSALQNPA